MNSFLLMLAQAGPPTGPAAPSGGAPSPPGAAAFFPFALMAALVVFMLLTARGQKKREKRKREELFDRMAKNDRVLTIGGVIGTIHSVKGDEVVLKVDESTNTKMVFTKSAVQKILGDELASST